MVVNREIGDRKFTVNETSVDGARVRVHGEKYKVDRTSYNTKLEFCFSEEEALYGLGSHDD